MENLDLYSQIIDIDNLILASRKARKHKTKKADVMEFSANLHDNILKLHEELKGHTYKPEPLKTFILRDPKTRKISKSAFRDRVVYHALIRVIEPIFDKSFIYDSCANRKGKGNLFAIKRFYKFYREITKNNCRRAFCLKADIKHYFEEIGHGILLDIIKRKISDKKVIWLIEQILLNTSKRGDALFTRKGMPLGNLTSQFLANVYLNELDYLVKHVLKAKYYIRYVDDFVILHSSKSQLKMWKAEIDEFLKNKLKLELHPEKSKISSLSKGIDFVGFRNFYYRKLLRKRNIRTMSAKIEQYKQGKLSYDKLLECFQGWNAYVKWADTYKLRKRACLTIK